MCSGLSQQVPLWEGSFHCGSGRLWYRFYYLSVWALFSCQGPVLHFPAFELSQRELLSLCVWEGWTHYLPLRFLGFWPEVYWHHWADIDQVRWRHPRAPYHHFQVGTAQGYSDGVECRVLWDCPNHFLSDHDLWRVPEVWGGYHPCDDLQYW